MKAAYTQTVRKQYGMSILPIALGLSLLSGGLAARADTYTVTNLADSGAGSLRQAIISADANAAANTIVFANGVRGTIELQSALPTLTGWLSIEVPGENLLAVGHLSTNGAAILISGLTISMGVAEPIGATCCGGGIRNTGDLVLNNCII